MIKKVFYFLPRESEKFKSINHKAISRNLFLISGQGPQSREENTSTVDTFVEPLKVHFDYLCDDPIFNFESHMNCRQTCKAMDVEEHIKTFEPASVKFNEDKKSKVLVAKLQDDDMKV